MRIVLPFLAVAIATPVGATAATLIESVSGDGQPSKLWVEGARARAESPDQPGYVLMDLSQGTMLMVNDEEKQVVDMSGQLQRAGTGAEPRPTVRLVNKGGGPKIAGYATRHYQLTADGEVCQDLYMSPRAYTDARLEAYGKAFSQYDLAPPFAQEPCDYATLAMDTHMAEGGLPMRVEQHGEVVDEIQRIVTNAKLPAGGFDAPAGYQRVDMGELMEQGMREMQEQMRQMHEDMSPEQMQEMERMLEQLAPKQQ